MYTGVYNITILQLQYCDAAKNQFEVRICSIACMPAAISMVVKHARYLMSDPANDVFWRPRNNDL